MTKLNREQLDLLIDNAAGRLNASPKLRYGQTLFNELENINPELADFIRGTSSDPFYDNYRTGNFFAAICDSDAWAYLIQKNRY